MERAWTGAPLNTPHRPSTTEDWRVDDYDAIPPVIECIDHCLSLPDILVEDPDPSGATSTRLVYEREKLEIGELYGIQINYRTADSQGDPVHVFSARDAYVWPSRELPGQNDPTHRLASYPIFGRHADKEYGYIICDETFFPDDSNLQKAWIAMLKDAFEQWEIATDRFVEMTPLDRSCTDTSLIQEFMKVQASDDTKSEIRMMDINIAQAIFASKEVMSDPYKICIVEAPACVTSRVDYDAEVRWAGDDLSGVDISFRKDSFDQENPVIVQQDGKPLRHPRIPTSVEFNKCPDLYPGPANPDPDLGYFAYTTALHEAGHALGLSGISEDYWKYFVDGVLGLFNLQPSELDIYSASHPSVTDSVMNYDSLISGSRNEPDCFPHPIDVMAIYGLYQTP